MPKYLFKAHFTAEAMAAVLAAGGSARRTAADGLARDLGGAVESYHFAFGDDDAYVICDLPDNKAAAKLAMTVSSSGRVSVTTVALVTVEEIDAIAAEPKLDYTPPGA